MVGTDGDLGRNAGIAAAAAVVVTLPWLIGVIGTHGFEALTSPANRFEPLVGLIRIGNLAFSGAPFMDVFAVFGVVGVIVATIRGPRRIPLLLLLTYLAGRGRRRVPGCGAVVAARRHRCRGAGRRHHPGRPAAGSAAGAVVLLLALIGSVGSVADGSSKLHALSAGHLEAMGWAGQHRPESVAIVLRPGVWGDDEISEWPRTGRPPQPRDGAGQRVARSGEAFESSFAIHNAIRDCSGATVGCYAEIDGGAVSSSPRASWRAVLAGGLLPGAAGDRRAAYGVIYDGPGATIAIPGG